MFGDLTRQILTESDLYIADWRRRITEALGVNAALVVDVVPDLDRLIGTQVPVPEIGPVESQNRFNLVFQRFVEACATEEHPIVMFFDDLQWADAPSLKLVEMIVTDKRIGHLLTIGALRETAERDEVLPAFESRIAEATTVVRHIRLGPLKLTDVANLIADTIGCDIDDVLELAELCIEKTGGNPFFLRQFLETLHARGSISFNSTEGFWMWALSEIRRVDVTDNVVKLMADRIEELPEMAQAALTRASCFGGRFDIKGLAEIVGATIEQTAPVLWRAMQIGLLSPLDESYKYIGDHVTAGIRYRFTRDRIQQAANSLVDEDTRRKTHLAIGRMLLREYTDGDSDSRIFDIVDHLNAATKLLDSEAEREKLSELNLKAGSKARTSAAFESAYSYYIAGLNLLGEDAFKARYTLTLKLHSGAIEATYLCGKTEEMANRAEVALNEIRSTNDAMPIYEVLMRSHISNNQHSRAIDLGLDVLRQLGSNIPRAPQKLRLALFILRAKLALARKSDDELIYGKRLEDRRRTAVAQVTATIGVAAYYSAPTLLAYLVLNQVVMFAQHGNMSLSAYVFVAYAMILCTVLGDIKAGTRFGRLALNMLEHFDAKDQAPRTMLVYYTMIHHRTAHIRDAIEPLLKAYRSALEVGDLEFASLNLLVHLYMSVLTGMNLANVREEMDRYADIVGQISRGHGYFLFGAWYQVVLNLRGEGEHSWEPKGTMYDYQVCEEIHRRENDRAMLSQLYLIKIILSILGGNFKSAAQSALDGSGYVEGQAGAGPAFSFYHFYAALALYNSVDGMTKSERSLALKRAGTHRSELKSLAKHCPENYRHKWLLVNAERSRVLHREEEALSYYNKAINAAREYGYVNEEAIANERAAAFHTSCGANAIAETYLHEAYACYQRWGATAKLRQLEHEHRFLADRFATVNRGGSARTERESVQSLPTSLDAGTLIKASQAISREIVLSALIDRLMRTIVENAGAGRGVLLLQRNGTLFAEAEARVVSGKIHVEQHADAVPSGDGIDTRTVPQAVVNYVARLRKGVVVENAQNDERFVHDEYLQNSGVRSVLCMPALNQNRLVGVVYLENDLTVGAFTLERLSFLEVMSSQVAISIENARNYLRIEELNRSLEYRIEERTRELNEKNEELVQSIQYALTIQRSILPRDDAIQAMCRHFFVIWKPRDVVGGDFYYFQRVGDNYLLGGIDCTGHGVPGAFMTMMVKSVLDRVVADICNDDPAIILKELNAILRATLNQGEARTLSDDGLDIGLCYVQPVQRTLRFAGAKLSLYFCIDGMVLEKRGDKQSIGYRTSTETFEYTNHSIGATRGTSFYLVTDGYYHQSGGAKGFSLGRRQLRRIFADIYSRPFDEQKSEMENRLEAYRGRIEQRDDIMAIGFQV